MPSRLSRAKKIFQIPLSNKNAIYNRLRKIFATDYQFGGVENQILLQTVEWRAKLALRRNFLQGLLLKLNFEVLITKTQL